jgi:hypothetical protein
LIGEIEEAGAEMALPQRFLCAIWSTKNLLARENEGLGGTFLGKGEECFFPFSQITFLLDLSYEFS